MRRRLDIPSPCDASWDAMTPVAEGRRCDRCATRVVDLTTMTAREATITASLFAPGSLCGRLVLSAALVTAGCGAKPIAEAPAMPQATASPEPAPPSDPDGDGIRGLADRCPNDPEDEDGLWDDDGCPDPDNDLDRIPDVDDKCPNKPETYNGFDDEDGCPDEGRIIIEPGQTLGWRTLDFDEGVAAPSAHARSILAEIAGLLRSRPGLGILRVRGAAGVDRTLARERADRVVAVLIASGVARDRVRASIGPDDDFSGVALDLVED